MLVYEFHVALELIKETTKVRKNLIIDIRLSYFLLISKAMGLRQLLPIIQTYLNMKPFKRFAGISVDPLDKHDGNNIFFSLQ